MKPHPHTEHTDAQVCEILLHEGRLRAERAVRERAKAEGGPNFRGHNLLGVPYERDERGGFVMDLRDRCDA